MDLHQLKVFHAVAKSNGFTHASRVLHLSQSTVSQHVKQLEEEFGCQLFMRVGKRVTLTEAGQTLLEHCEQIFQLVKNTEMTMRELTGLRRGKVRFGTGATTLISQLPPVLEAYQTQFPHIELIIVSDISDNILDAVRAHRLDLGLVMLPVGDADLQVLHLCTEELKVALPARHPMAQKKYLTIEDLKKLRFILYEQQTIMRRFIDNYFASLGVSPQIAMVMENIEAIKSLVGTGLGASVLPTHAVGEDIADRKVKLLRVQKAPLYRQLGLVTLKSDYIPAAVRELYQLIRKELGDKIG